MVDKVHQNFFPPGKLAIIYIFIVNIVEQILFEMDHLQLNLKPLKSTKSGRKSRLTSTEESNPVDELYRALNRIVLYHVSHLVDKSMSAPAVLNKLIDSRNILFSELNDDIIFFMSL